MKTIKVTKAAKQDKGLTIRTSQFPGRVFEVGDKYILEFSGGDIFKCKVSRGGDTLYGHFITNSLHKGDLLPDIGNPRKYFLKEFYKKQSHGVR